MAQERLSDEDRKALLAEKKKGKWDQLEPKERKTRCKIIKSGWKGCGHTYKDEHYVDCVMYFKWRYCCCDRQKRNIEMIYAPEATGRGEDRKDICDSCYYYPKSNVEDVPRAENRRDKSIHRSKMNDFEKLR